MIKSSKKKLSLTNSLNVINFFNKVYKKIKITFAKDNPKKIRIRSKSELNVRKKEFLKVCILLDKLKIRYFLAAGTLLGAVRHKDFIPWDWDVEISVYANETQKKIDKLIKEIKKSGFTIIKYSKELPKLKIDFFGKYPKETTSYTIQGWCYNKKKKIYWRNKFKVPDNLIKNMKKIDLFNKKHLAPYPPEDYLTHQYGNWKKPIRTSDKSVYLTRRFSGISILETIIKKIFF